MDDTMTLIERSHHGDKKARERLVEENMGLVWSIVRRFSGRGTDNEDLFQIGAMGLIKAIDKFDTSFEVKFSTYAVPMITGEIKRFLRDDGMIKVSRILKETAVKASRAKAELERRKGSEPTMEELSLETGISMEELAMAMEAVSDVESLSQPVYSGDGKEMCLEDRLQDKQDQNEILLNRMLLEHLLNMLEQEERLLIQLRYFEEKTQSQVAARLGISQVQVSRAEKKILQKMRERV